MRILDAHQHFWRPARGDYGWLAAAPPVLNRDYLPVDLQGSLARYGVDRTILVQAAPTEAETDFMLDLADRTPFVAGVVGWLDMDGDSFPDRLAHYAARPKFVGIRPMLQDLEDDEWILRPRVLRNLQLVAESGLAFDFLTLPRHLPHVATALQQTPGLRAVIDHISKPLIAKGTLDPWRADIERVASFRNVFCKVSGIITEADPRGWSVADLRPYIHHVVNCFGPDRLIFGSDWPVCRLAGDYGDVLSALLLALPPRLRGDEGLFRTNAERFYRLA